MTTTVTIKAMGEVGRILGWNEKEVEFEGSTLEDLLKSLETLDGRSFYELVLNEGKLSGGYVFTLNGQVVTSLQTPLTCGDRIMTMEMVRIFQGG
jgi:sulfur carrier protein ThiS